MLANKLIQKIIFSPFRANSIYLFAAEKKVPQSKQAPKQTAKQPSKGAPGQAKTQNKPPAQTQASTNPNTPNTDKKQQEQAVSTSFSVKSRSGSFYRKMVRNLNFKKKTGRAIFNEQSLKQIIDIASRKDLGLIFQAYYNFLGHYTVISNTTVDALVNKAISLGNINRTVREQAIVKVFDTLKNHEYLGYFPHYTTTLKSAELAIKAQKYPQFLQVLNNKLLIKLNSETIKGLYELTTQWKDFVRLTNIIIIRARLNLFKSIQNQELVQYFSKSIETIQGIDQEKKKKQVQLFVKKLNNAKQEALKKQADKSKRYQQNLSSSQSNQQIQAKKTVN